MIPIIQPKPSLYEHEGGLECRMESLSLGYLAANIPDSMVIQQEDLYDESVADMVVGSQMVMFSTYTNNFSRAKRIAEKIRQNDKDIQLIIGGYHATGCVKHYDTHPKLLEEIMDIFDICAFGEGELTAKELVHRISSGEAIDDIRGIAYQRDHHIYINPPSQRIRDLDSYPFPERQSYDLSSFYQDVPGMPPKEEQIFATIHSSRGCRYRCDFCCTPIQYGRGVTTRSAQSVIDEIIDLVERRGVNTLFVADEDFFFDKKRAMQIFEGISKYDLSVRTFARADDLTDIGYLDKLRSHGLKGLLMGIETTDDTDLQQMGKKEKFAQILDALKLCHEADIKVKGTYMLDPRDDPDTIHTNLHKLEQAKGLRGLYMTILTPFPGTPLYKELHDRLLHNEWQFYNTNNIVFEAAMGQADLLQIKKRFLQEFGQ